MAYLRTIITSANIFIVSGITGAGYGIFLNYGLGWACISSGGTVLVLGIIKSIFPGGRN